MTFALARPLAALDVTSPFPGPMELERRRGRPYRARLGANECLFGVSPAVLRTLRERGPEIALYCDPVHAALRDAIAAAWSLRREQIVVAEGIEGLLGLFVRAFIDSGDVAVTSYGGYPSFDYYVRGCGGRMEHVPYLESRCNDAAGLAAASRRHAAKLVFLANPDNPTGTLLPAESIRRLLAELPVGCVLLLDEAYAEFAEPDQLLARTEVDPKLIRLRTFSKAFGLAGARVGYGIAVPELIRELEKVRQHFGVSRLSQELALAALGDHAFVASVLAETRHGLDDYRRLAAGVGARVLSGSANFAAFDFGSAARAEVVARWLETHDVFVRRPREAPLDALIRITVGPPDARAYLADVLPRAVASVEGAVRAPSL